MQRGRQGGGIRADHPQAAGQAKTGGRRRLDDALVDGRDRGEPGGAVRLEPVEEGALLEGREHHQASAGRPGREHAGDQARQMVQGQEAEAPVLDAQLQGGPDLTGGRGQVALEERDPFRSRRGPRGGEQEGHVLRSGPAGAGGRFGEP